MSSQQYDAVILGAGVIGLSIALELESHGFKVAIAAKDLPDDVTSTGFASPWAGCNWHSFEMDPNSRALKRDVATYKRLGKVAQEHPDLCERIEFIDVYDQRVKKETIPWHHITGDFREVVGSTSDPLPANKPHGHKFTSYVLDAPKYTQHLGRQARAKGIPILRKRVTSLDEAYNIPEIGRVDLVINATGLGAKSLIGVMDKDVYPARGQTVLVRAPKVKTCIMAAGDFLANTQVKDGDPKTAAPPPPPYIIPRPGPEGHVVCGGTYIRHEYSTLPDLEAAEQILKGCFELDPRLANGGTSWKDIEVVSINVGLRPSRQGGARVELERRKVGDGALDVGPMIESRERGRNVGVIHAYGFAGVGYVGSLGAAEEVVKLAREYKGQSDQAVQAKL